MPTGDEQLYRPLDRAVLEALAEGVVWQAADGRVVDANSAAAAILGLLRDELLDRTPRDPRWYAVHEDGAPWPADDHPAVRALRTGQPQRGAVMGIMAPGGGRRWISINSTPMTEASAGGPGGVISSFIDVTEQVEQRRRLEEANRELADLYEHAPCGYHMLDAQGHFLRINDTALDWLGCSREEAVGHLGPFDFMPEASRQSFWRCFEQLLAGHRLDGVEVDIVSRSGQARRIRASVSPILDARGCLAATRSVWHDISELHVSRTQLEQLAAQQAAVLDNDLVGIVRLRGRTIEWKNRAFDRILGYGGAELLGQDTSVLYPDVQAFRQLGEAAYTVLRSGGVFRAQLELRRKDGQLVWVDCSGFMLNSNTNEAIWFLRDISEQRRAQELRVKAAQLQAENRQLLETRRLQQLFLSNMSHEMRTPLNAVLGFAQLLRASAVAPGSERQQLYLEHIENNGRQLLSMIDSILTTADAETGKLAFIGERIDAVQAVEEVVALLEPLVAERQARIEVAGAQTLGPLQLDPLRLRQILLGYVENAIKFSRQGGRVQVRLIPVSADRFRIEVEDEGIGIRSEDLPRLFTEFDQLSAGSTKAYAGVGVGLALVKRLVEAQGGSVAVRSRWGEGSVFVAEMPRRFPLP
jgi:PAS domain S-box-containing protein